MDLVAKPLTLRILPIPGRPDFKGPVGRFDLSARVDRTRVAVGDAVTFKVRLAGAGNLRTASDPPALKVSGVRVYPPTTKNDPSHLGRLQTSTEWSWVLVPTEKGAIAIPPVSIEMFDPAEKRFVTKTTAPIEVLAEGGPGTVAAAAGTAVAETTLPEAPKVSAAPAASPTPDRAAVDLAHGTVTFPLWALAALPAAVAVAAGGALAVARRRRRRSVWQQALDPEPGETKERAAARVDRALREALARRHALDEALGPGELLEALRDKGLPEGRIADVKALLDDVEFLRFAPQLGEYDARIRETRARAARVLPLVG